MDPISNNQLAAAAAEEDRYSNEVQGLNFDLDLEEVIQIPQRSVPGVEIKHMDNHAFSSTVYFIIEIKGHNKVHLSAADEKELVELHQSAAKKWGRYLVGSLGIFDWEKHVAYIRNINKRSIIVESSCYPAMSMGHTLNVIINCQIKIDHSGSETSHIMIKSLPREQEALRANLMMDLTMLLQHEVLGFVDSLPEVSTFSLIRNPVVFEPMYLKYGQAFQNCNGFTRCSVQKLELPEFWTRGFLLTLKRTDQLEQNLVNQVPLLWARKCSGIKPCCLIFEAKDDAENRLLGMIRSKAFGRHTVYGKYEIGKINYFKEIAAIKLKTKLHLKLHKKTDEMTLLLPTDPLYTPSPGLWKNSKGDYKYKSLEKKWEAGDRSELRVFKNDQADKGQADSCRPKVRINDDSGNLVLQLFKSKSKHYILEYKLPFDALTAFSVILPTF